jgi:hypothetical protein
MSLENLSLEARDELAALAQTLAENPDTRKDFLRMTRKVKPDLPIPELDIEDYTHREVSRSEDRVQALEAKLREKEAIEELNSRRQSLMKKGLISNESEVGDVEKNYVGAWYHKSRNSSRIPSVDETSRSADFIWIQPKCCQAI